MREEVLRELNKLAESISYKLQRMEDLISKNNIKEEEIPLFRFPRKVIREAHKYKEEIKFIDDEIIKSNIAYTWMVTDVYRWLITRTDIDFAAKSLLIKQWIIATASIIEAIVTYIASQITKREIKSVNTAVKILFQSNIIKEEDMKALKDIWGQRNKIHIGNIKEKEYAKYSENDYLKAIQTLQTLINRLNKVHYKG